MKILITLLAIFFIVSLSSINWRFSVKSVLFIVVIEGALRKWFLPQASDFIYFLKDFVLIGAYINYYLLSNLESKPAIKNHIINIFVFLISGWCLVQAFNPSLGSPILGIVGLKGYLLNIPLIWINQTLFKSEYDLYRFFRTYIILTIPIGILGIVQFFSSPLSPINAYINSAEAKSIATFGDGNNFARITGSFSYLDTYVVYLIVSFGLLISLFSIPTTVKWKCTYIVALILVIVNSFMTGSRSCVFALALIILGYMCIKSFFQPAKLLRFLKQLLLPTLIIVTAASIWFRPAIDAFSSRVNNSDDSSSRVTIRFTQPFDYINDINYKGIDGYGTGATQATSKAISKLLSLPEGEALPVPVEEEPLRIMLELGPIGFTFWYGLKLSILITLWTLFCQVKSSFLRELVLIAFMIQAIRFDTHLVLHHVFSVYYWFFSSFIFMLPRLDQINNRYQQQFLQQNVEATNFPGSSN
ncbi:hypothetical protein NIES4073_57220 [Kalymmatonema gypsitolerans NIES-4073]|nr:hypothetical protein NIES4073_57220 [Scytonema sp. NIES-4073]